MLGMQELVQVSATEFEWQTPPVRVWPEPERSVHWNLPADTRTSLDEAQKCFSVGAYNACAVMCGRVLETICREHNVSQKVLAGGLQELLERRVIDWKLFDWGEELRRHRNIGAHASTEKISQADARDLLEFANAICDYVFVLTERFEQFMKR